MQATTTPHVTSVRPLVRYVDAEQAVIDVHVTLPPRYAPASDPHVELLMQIAGSDGFQDESRVDLPMLHGTGSARFEVVQPQRWWPAGMGEQPLYELTLALTVHNELLDTRTVTIGLTSVRPDASHEEEDAHGPRLLVNGQVWAVRSVLPVDRVDESQLLPATGDSVLLVRDHYGPDVLYQAADRAGVLLVQCVPIHPEAAPEIDVQAQVDRLAAHPSLAGWFVGHLGRLSDEVAGRIQALDPTRNVFRHFPVEPIEPAA
ncbi:MAG: hypothetical protein ACODAQ_07815 [Phycisphaeraceae bacterium]